MYVGFSDMGINRNIKNLFTAWAWWLIPIILATWKAEIRRIAVLGQAWQRVRKIPSQPMAG
jgi:hypothetical protein